MLLLYWGRSERLIQGFNDTRGYTTAFSITRRYDMNWTVLYIHEPPQQLLRLALNSTMDRKHALFLSLEDEGSPQVDIPR